MTSSEPEAVGPTRELFRSVNDQVQGLGFGAGARTLDYVCECDDGECFLILRIPPEAFDAFRAAGCFLVADGHAGVADEVVETGDGFVAVRRGSR